MRTKGDAAAAMKKERGCLIVTETPPSFFQRFLFLQKPFMAAGSQANPRYSSSSSVANI